MSNLLTFSLLVTLLSPVVLSFPGPFSVPAGCRRSSECAKIDDTVLTQCTPDQKCISLSTSKTPPPNLPPISLLTAVRQSVTRNDAISAINSASDLSTQKSRLEIIEYAIAILRDVHPHRDFHVKKLKVDPVPPLQALRMEVTDDMKLSNFEFMIRLWDIFNSIRDFHTQISVTSLREATAFLPFNVQDFYDKSKAKPRYVVTDLAVGFTPSNKSFKKGVEIVTWNGRPIQDIVENGGAQTAAANKGALQRAGVVALTWRSLSTGGFPDRASAQIGFRDTISKKGPLEQVMVMWRYAKPFQTEQQSAVQRQVAFTNVDNIPNAHKIPSEKKEITGTREFNHLHITGRKMGMEVQITPIKIESCVQDVFAADIIKTESLTFGRIVMYTFSSNPADVAKEYLRLLRLLPQQGLVLDLRGNRGGATLNAFVTLFPLTTKVIQLPPAVLRVSNVTKQAVEQTSGPDDGFLGPFRASTIAAFNAKKPFSEPISLFNESQFAGATNNTELKGVLPRPTIIVTDGFSYSSSEYVAATAMDNDFGLVVGVDSATGGGGSVVSSPASLLSVLPPAPTSDVSFAFSLLKILRAGKKKGKGFEFDGIKPKTRYFPTLQDRTGIEEDFFNFLATTFKKKFKK